MIAPHARYKVWVKPNGEMPFLYGGNVVKAHVGRWSEDCPEHQGVVVLGMDDTPLVGDLTTFAFRRSKRGFGREALTLKRGLELRQDQRLKRGDSNRRASRRSGKQILAST